MNAAKRLLILVLATSLSCFTLLGTGCSSRSDEDVVAEALSQELDNFKNGNEATINELAESFELDSMAEYGIDNVSFIRSYLNGFDYSIENVAIEGDTATVTFTLTRKTLDAFESALATATDELLQDDSIYDMTEDEINALLGETLMSAIDSVPLTTSAPLTITYTKSDNVWTPNADAANVIESAMLSD